jgi:hypothetical protein
MIGLILFVIIGLELGILNGWYLWLIIASLCGKILEFFLVILARKLENLAKQLESLTELKK